MTGSPSATDESARPDARVAFALAAVIVVALLARAQASLVPDFVAGDDGAYYLVQVRAILREGRLALPDFPLLFYAQAAIAGILSPFVDQRAAIVAAVRWTDTIVPVVLAVPVYLFVRAFRRGGTGSTGPVLAMVFAGLVATVSGNSLLMAGGTIKNAAALPFSLLFVFHLYRTYGDGGRRSAAPAVAFLLVSSLTHVSALALNGTLATLFVAAALAAPAVRARVLRPALMLLAALASVVGVILAIDPDHAWRLLGVLAHPGRFIEGSLLTLWLQGAPHLPVEEVVTSEEVWLGNGLGLLGLYALWRHRADTDGATRAILWATTLTTLFFSSPLLAPDLLKRLALVAYVPGLVPLAFLLCRDASAVAVVAPMTALVVLAGALAVKTNQVTALVRPAYEELVRLKTALPPGRSIVITRHGLAWWMVWTMDVHFSARASRALADREAYDAVLLLDEIAPGAFGRQATRLARATPGAAVFDGDLLRSETITTLAEGVYFRLSRVGEPEAPEPEGRPRS